MSLKAKVRALKKGQMRSFVDARIAEFEEAGARDEDYVFGEMCFCILTANFNAERAIVIQEALGPGFIEMPKRHLASRLKSLGHRYPNARADYIVEARRHRGSLKRTLGTLSGHELRHWLASSVKGLGYKEASHFLRNIGHKDYAILDFHIIDIMEEHGLLKRPKSLTPKRYIEIEAHLKEFGKGLGMNMAELDLYLWYLETGKILK